MIRINYNQVTGEPIVAYGDNFDKVPAPYIDVENSLWASAQGKPCKVVNGKLVIDEFQFSKNTKHEENKTKKDSVSKLQVVLNGAKYFLFLDTPTMPLPTIMLAFKQFQEKNLPLPAGSFRYYDSNGNSFDSPSLSPSDIDLLYWQMFYKYSAIDKYYNSVVVKIDSAATPQDANAIVIDYASADVPLTDASFAFAQGMTAKDSGVTPSGGGTPATGGANADLSNVLPADLDRAIRLTNAYHELAAKAGTSHGEIAKNAKYIESQTPVDLSAESATVIHLAFQFTADNQTITQALPNSSKGIFFILENILAGHTGCKLTITTVSGDTFDGKTDPKDFTGDSIIGVAVPTTNAGYSWVPFPIMGNSTLVVSDGTNIAMGVKSLRFDGAVIQSQNGETLVHIPSGGGSGTGTGTTSMTFTDANAKTVTGVNTVVLQNAKIGTYVDEPNKIDISSSVLFMEETGKRTQATSVLVQEPIKITENNSVVGQVVLGMNQNSFQQKEDDSYLSYLGNNVELNPSKVEKSGDYIPDVIWFDSVQKENGDYIQVDASSKSFGLQETDGLDPNISDGTKYLVSVYLDFLGKAESDCFISLLLRKTGTTEYVTDANGNPVFVAKDVKKGTDFGTVSLSVILSEKGIDMMQVCVIHNHVHNIVAKGTAYGVSGLLVQMLDKGTTSPAKSQYEIDTKTSIRLAKFNFNELYNTAFQFSKPSEQHTFDANYKEKTADGYYFCAKSSLDAWVENRNMRITNDAKKTPVNFEMGVILDPVVTAELGGRDIVTHHIVTLDKANLGVSLFAWTGDGAPTYPIISGKGADGYPTTNKGWVNTMNSEITGDPNKQSDLITFNLPKSAKVAAFLIYPKESYSDFNMTLQEFTVSVGTPFVDYVIKGIDESKEHHYVYADELAKFQMTQFGAGLRYTINKADTKLPVGTKRSGNAPIELTKAWTDSGFDGEGALKFDVDGKAKITTKLRLYAGENVPAGDFTEATFWYARANADGTFAKIPASEFTFTLKKNDIYPRIFQLSFKSAINKNDVLWLFGKTSKFDDGAYIQSAPGVVLPFVDTDIVFTTPETN